MLDEITECRDMLIAYIPTAYQVMAYIVWPRINVDVDGIIELALCV